MNKKKVVMVMPHMVGGGAERVAAQIMNKLNERGYDTRFILTSAKKNEVIRSDLNEKTQLILLTEELKAETTGQKLAHLPERAYSTIFGKLYEKQNKYVPASVGRATIEWQYHREIAWLRNYFQQNPDMTVIVFLQPSIPIVLLAAQGLSNRILISERGNAEKLMKKRYGYKFIEKYYIEAQSIIFQTKFARDVFPKNVTEKGIIIKNPLKSGLPDAYHGERKKYITTFCRLSPDKDLMTLMEAYALFHNEYPEFKLKIIGDANNYIEKKVKDELTQYVKTNRLEDNVIFLPFMKDVHKEIIKDSMYVNSSINEGLSNAMLEAMAIGMPVVCTDCPIGGAKDTIISGENGFLVPVKDTNALYKAMKRIIENKDLMNRVSLNASEIRKSLTLDRIVDQWEKEIL